MSNKNKEDRNISTHTYSDIMRLELTSGCDFVRLSEYEKKAIRETIYKLDKEAKIYLFGSRVDDAKKGGDIDLIIFSKKLLPHDVTRIRYKLWDELGEQKIDIIIAKDNSQPFTRVALQKSIRL